MSVNDNILVIGYLRSVEQLLKDSYSYKKSDNNNNNILSLLPDLIVTTTISYYGKLIDKIGNDDEEVELFPSLVIFDLDDCLWSPETYTLRGNMTGVIKENNLITGIKFGYDILSLHDGARAALLEIYESKYDKKCIKNKDWNINGNMRVALASSAVTQHAVKCANKAISTIEIASGITVRDVVNRGWNKNIINSKGHIQIGRSFPLSSDKSKTHIPFIQKATGIPYNEMVFFDDCNWDDNCRMVERNCVGVVGQRTPYGLQVKDWQKGLKKWQKRYNKG